jgi:hypothetical protein
MKRPESPKQSAMNNYFRTVQVTQKSGYGIPAPAMTPE